jgi:hypothetical protein
MGAFFKKAWKVMLIVVLVGITGLLLAFGCEKWSEQEKKPPISPASTKTSTTLSISMEPSKQFVEENRLEIISSVVTCVIFLTIYAWFRQSQKKKVRQASLPTVTPATPPTSSPPPPQTWRMWMTEKTQSFGPITLSVILLAAIVGLLFYFFPHVGWGAWPSETIFWIVASILVLGILAYRFGGKAGKGLLVVLILVFMVGLIYQHRPSVTAGWREMTSARKSDARLGMKEKWVILFYGVGKKADVITYRSEATVRMTGHQLEVTYKGSRGGKGWLRGEFDRGRNAFVGEGCEQGWSGTFWLRPNNRGDCLEGICASPKHSDHLQQQGGRLQLIRQ